MGQSTISTEKVVLHDELDYNGVTLLTYRIEYPRFTDGRYQTCLTVVNSFYHTRAINFLSHCENELFKLAVEQYKVDRERGFPVRVFEAVLVYEIPYCDSCILSLYTDRYEYTGGAHGNTLRESQTWNLQRCAMIKLRQLVRCAIGLKTYVTKAVKDQIRHDPVNYFDDYPTLVLENFQDTNFYCTPESVVIYYQQYDIAPYASGIREFPLIYGGCVIDPAATCFYN